MHRRPRRSHRPRDRPGSARLAPRPRHAGTRARRSPPSSSARPSRAQARGGLAAAAAFLQRAVALTDDPARRGERALAAAQASLQAGAFDAALGLLATAEAGPLDEFQRARVDLVRAHVAFASGFGSDAPALLMIAARGLEPFDLGPRSRDLPGRVGRGGDGRIPRTRHPRWRSAAPSRPSLRRAATPLPLDLLLDGLALLITDGHAAAAPILQRAAEALTSIPARGRPAVGLDGHVRQQPGVGHRELPRDLGATRPARARRRRGGAAAPPPLAAGVVQHVDRRPLRARPRWRRRARASRRRPEARSRRTRCCGSGRCREAKRSSRRCWRARPSSPRPRGRGSRRAGTGRTAVLCNGLGRYEEAASAAQEAASDTVTRRPAMWALPELVEAAARSGDTELARDALERLVATTQPCDTDFARGIEARCRALLSDGAAAEELLPRSDRAVEPHPAPSGPRPRPPALRRVAAPRGPARRRPRAAAHGPRHARRDRHGGVRRARPPGADRHGREGAQAQRRDAATSSRRRRSRSPASPATACRTRRSARSCSSAPAPSSGTCARSSRSSTSAPAGSSGRRSPRTTSPSPAPSGAQLAPDRAPGTPGVDDQGVPRAHRASRGVSWVVNNHPRTRPVGPCQRRAS